MTIARHRPLNIPRAWNWDNATRQLVTMGFDPVSCWPFSADPAPEPLEGNNLGLRTGGRIGALQLVAVRIYHARMGELVTPLPSTMSVTTSTDVTLFFRTDLSVRSARFTLDGEPMAEILAEGSVVLCGDSVEPNGQRVVTSGFREAGKLRVLADDDLAGLMDAIVTVGGERDDAPDEAPLIDPRWPVEVQLSTLAGLLRKALHRLDALESGALTMHEVEESHLVFDDDEPDAKPRRAHRRVHPLPDVPE